MAETIEQWCGRTGNNQSEFSRQYFGPATNPSTARAKVFSRKKGWKVIYDRDDRKAYMTPDEGAFIDG